MITALRYLQLWLADISSVHVISTSDSHIGTTFDVIRSGSVETWQIVKWQPLQHLQFSAQQHHWIMLLKPIDQQTRLTLINQWPQHALTALLLRSVHQRRLIRRSLDRLKELIVFNRDIALVHGIGDE